MKTASIVFTDSADGQDVDVRVDFGEGSDDNSGAHRLAMQALTLLFEYQAKLQDDYKD